MKLYALHDRKACAFSSFHVERSDAQASRGFADAVRAKDSVFSKYPEDFELVSLCDVHAEYDEFPPQMTVGAMEFRVVLTASQVVSLDNAANAQLSLLKEA